MAETAASFDDFLALADERREPYRRAMDTERTAFIQRSVDDRDFGLFSPIAAVDNTQANSLAELGEIVPAIRDLLGRSALNTRNYGDTIAPFTVQRRWPNNRNHPSSKDCQGVLIDPSPLHVLLSNIPNAINIGSHQRALPIGINRLPFVGACAPSVMYAVPGPVLAIGFSIPDYRTRTDIVAPLVGIPQLSDTVKEDALRMWQGREKKPLDKFLTDEELITKPIQVVQITETLLRVNDKQLKLVYIGIKQAIRELERKKAAQKQAFDTSMTAKQLSRQARKPYWVV